MTSLYAVIKTLQTTQGTKAKRAVLEAYKGDELVKAYMKAVLDPAINYYITKLPKASEPFVAERDFDEYDLIDLIKLTTREVSGKAAKEFLSARLGALNAEGKLLLEYIIKRDIRASVGETMTLAVWPNLFFVPPYQRCASMDVSLKERFGDMEKFYVQSKSDGQFAYVIRNHNGAAVAMSRAGSIHPTWLADKAAEGLPEGLVAMGELLVYRSGVLMNRQEGNGVLNSVLSGDGSKFKTTDSVKFLAWDLVTVEEFKAGKSERPYEERLTQLALGTKLDTIPMWTVTSVKEANALQAKHVARGEEGTVWKNPAMKWRDCSSGDKDMMKAKIVFEADYEILDTYEGEGKAAGMLGGLTLATCDRKIVFNCGSGYSDALRKELWAIRSQLPGMIASAEGNDVVSSKGKDTLSVFLPIFTEIRLDKKVADCHDRVFVQLNAAKEGRLDT